MRIWYFLCREIGRLVNSSCICFLICFHPGCLLEVRTRRYPFHAYLPQAVCPIIDQERQLVKQGKTTFLRSLTVDRRALWCPPRARSPDSAQRFGTLAFQSIILRVPVNPAPLLT